jgi:hypothetical protein
MYSKFTLRYETFIDLEIRKELMLANKYMVAREILMWQSGGIHAIHDSKKPYYILFLLYHLSHLSFHPIYI